MVEAHSSLETGRWISLRASPCCRQEAAAETSEQPLGNGVGLTSGDSPRVLLTPSEGKSTPLTLSAQASTASPLPTTSASSPLRVSTAQSLLPQQFSLLTVATHSRQKQTSTGPQSLVAGSPGLPKSAAAALSLAAQSPQASFRVVCTSHPGGGQAGKQRSNV